MRIVLAVAGVTAVVSAGTAVPAVARPAAVQSAAGPGVSGWGYNGLGELGDGTTTQRNSPVQVSGLPGTVRQIAAGQVTSAAVLSDGSVWAWGDNFNGVLGNGTFCNCAVTTPRQVPGVSAITEVAVSIGSNDVYAVRSDGSLWAWGSNQWGQLGNGTTASSYTPVQVPGLTGITQVSGGPSYVLAVRSDGTVWAWGDNSFGELGDGTTVSHLAPEQVPGLTGIRQVSASGPSFAVRSDGTLFAWGPDNYGVLGNGTAGGFVTSPVPVPGLTGITQVASSDGNVLALAGSGGTVWAWGINNNGQLGDGTTTSRLSPEPLPLTGITQIAITYYNSAAVRSDGTLWTWGDNSAGQLGTGICCAAANPVPVQVTALTGVSQVAAGGGYDLAVGSSAVATVPGLIGDTTAQASQALQAAGLVLGTVYTAVDNTCNNIGTVMTQNPAAGSIAYRGSAVSITIGKRPPRPCP